MEQTMPPEGNDVLTILLDRLKSVEDRIIDQHGRLSTVENQTEMLRSKLDHIADLCERLPGVISAQVEAKVGAHFSQCQMLAAAKPAAAVAVDWSGIGKLVGAAISGVVVGLAAMFGWGK
jgi:enoyl reductase-like protein